MFLSLVFLKLTCFSKENYLSVQKWTCSMWFPSPSVNLHARNTWSKNFSSSECNIFHVKPFDHKLFFKNVDDGNPFSSWFTGKFLSPFFFLFLFQFENCIGWRSFNWAKQREKVTQVLQLSNKGICLSSECFSVLLKLRCFSKENYLSVHKMDCSMWFPSPSANLHARNTWSKNFSSSECNIFRRGETTQWSRIDSVE